MPSDIAAMERTRRASEESTCRIVWHPPIGGDLVDRGAATGCSQSTMTTSDHHALQFR